MSTTSHWWHTKFWRRQFSLRTLLAITLLVCAWLAYQGHQHRAEMEIAETISKLDSTAYFVWRGPNWWLDTIGHRPAGMLEQIRHITLHGEHLTVDNVAQLPLHRLSGLRQIQLVDTVIWDEDVDALRARFNGQFQIVLSSGDPGIVHPVATAFLQKRDSETKTRLCRTILQKARLAGDFRTSPREIDSRNMNVIDEDEDALFRLLEEDDEVRLLAARTLWRLRSVRYAQAVIHMMEALEPSNEHRRRLKEEIAADLEQGAILTQIHNGNPRWGSWLATLYPDPALTASMLATIERGAIISDETINALSRIKDPQIVSSLVPLLSSESWQAGGPCVQILISQGGELLETKLIEGLNDDNPTFTGRAIAILKAMGTNRCESELERVRDDPKFADSHMWIRQAADQAIEQIRIRRYEQRGRR